MKSQRHSQHTKHSAASSIRPSWKRCSSLKVSARALRRLSEGSTRSLLCWNWLKILWKRKTMISCIINSTETWLMKGEIVNHTTNNARFSSKCRIIQTFKAQKMQASPRQKWPESCLKLLLKMSSCQSTCEGVKTAHLSTYWHDLKTISFSFKDFRSSNWGDRSYKQHFPYYH